MRIHRPPRTAATVVAVVLCLTLTACAAAGPSAPTSPSTRATTSAARPAITMLALGDSTVWDHDCTDCSHSYPHIVSSALAKRIGKPVALIDATQHNGLRATTLLAEIDANAWGDVTEDPNAPAPKAAIAAADIVTITLGANDAPWQQDDDPVCDGAWQTTSCFDQTAAPSLKALGGVLALIRSLRAGKPTAVRVTTFYNELVTSRSSEYVPDRPAAWIAKGATSARVYSDRLNDGICATPRAHSAICIDLYHAVNGREGLTPLPANWFYWSGHARGYDQTFTADAIMRAGFAELGV